MSKLSVYIYYKVPANDRIHNLASLKHLQHAVQTRFPMLKIVYQKRPELDVESKELWMETYHGVATNELAMFKRVLSELARQYGLPNERKFEVFTTL